MSAANGARVNGTPAQPAVVQMLPFVASAHEHTEPAFTVTITPGSSEQAINPIDIPASGYLRHVFLEVTLSGGGGTTPGVLEDDAPWNLFSSIALQDVNGANIFGPLDGYATYLSNLVGGYAFNADPANSPFFNAGSEPTNFKFYLRVPVEISHHDGLGALTNQNAAANYKLNLAINQVSTIWDTPPVPVPSVQIKGWLEAWTLPAPVDSRNRPQSQVPPMLGTGQYWSSRRQSVLTGDNTVALTRVGNLIRALVFVGRNTSGVRSDSVLPDPFRFTWDGMTIHHASQAYMQQFFHEKISGTTGATSRPTGVLVLPFNHGGFDQAMGNEDPSLWLPTTQSSRLEVTGTFAADGSVQVITNEVAPVEIDQAARYAEHSQSTHTPGA